VFWPTVFDEFGVSMPWNERPLRGVDFVIVGRLPSTVIGTTISDGVMASAQGLFDGSGSDVFLPVLLSLLLSRMLLGSPLTARARYNPDELEPEFESGATLVVTLDVSICNPG
jgi:hypothetical protein